MIPSLRKQFNAGFTAAKYQAFLQRIDEVCGTHVEFRLSETPCFFPKALLDQMAADGKELIRQLVDNPEYRKVSDASIPEAFHVSNEAPNPMFIQVDFGLVQRADGSLTPKLVELQAFPSLYAYQAQLSQAYLDVFHLRAFEGGENLRYYLGGLDSSSYQELLSRAIVADHDPANVILLEVDPLHQKTLPDFLLTEKLLGIQTVDISSVKKTGNKLYYEHLGKSIPIHRIYNRAIVDELERRGVRPAFDWRDDLDVEWAGHPNWYFRISKFSIPYLQHESAPKTWFLDRLDALPDDLENYVLKPLYSFAGRGVVIGPGKSDIDAIPAAQCHEYILQERVQFHPVIETPFGATKAEVRVMYVWVDELQPVLTILRTGRGLMMGVDHNKNLEWVGASAGLYLNLNG
jgi:hypothetical protein